MKTATVADLRNHFPKVAAWIARGEEVQITRRGKTVARLLPPAASAPTPDRAAWFRATLHDLWHGSTLTEDPVEVLRSHDEGPSDDLIR